MVALAMVKGGKRPMKICTHPNCTKKNNLAICELCMHWVCPDHRMLVGQIPSASGEKPPGGLNAHCIECGQCNRNMSETKRLLGPAVGVWSKGKGKSKNGKVKTGEGKQ